MASSQQHPIRSCIFHLMYRVFLIHSHYPQTLLPRQPLQHYRARLPIPCMSWSARSRSSHSTLNLPRARYHTLPHPFPSRHHPSLPSLPCPKLRKAPHSSSSRRMTVQYPNIRYRHPQKQPNSPTDMPPPHYPTLTLSLCPPPCFRSYINRAKSPSSLSPPNLTSLVRNRIQSQVHSNSSRAKQSKSRDWPESSLRRQTQMMSLELCSAGVWSVLAVSSGIEPYLSSLRADSAQLPSSSAKHRT